MDFQELGPIHGLPREQVQSPFLGLVAGTRALDDRFQSPDTGKRDDDREFMPFLKGHFFQLHNPLSS
jgi:hypothetical protein